MNPVGDLHDEEEFHDKPVKKNHRNEIIIKNITGTSKL